MKKTTYLTLLLIAIVQFSYAAGRKQTTEEYIEKYSDIAVKEMKKYGIPASITLAQGILESNSGNSTLATKAKNHFGIKKHDWNGSTITVDDDKKNEKFRKYKSVEDSYRDHSLFLTERARYEDLFKLRPNDYKGWAKGLKSAGYATDPKYASLLINLIERYELYDYDKGGKSKVSKTTPTPYMGRDVYVNNHVKYIVVEEGETFESLSKQFGMRLWELPSYNNLSEKHDLKAGDILYVRNKRSKSEKGINFHMVEDGESLLDISQMYGVRIKSILHKNRMKVGEQIEVGQVLFLHYRIPKGMEIN